MDGNDVTWKLTMVFFLCWHVQQTYQSGMNSPSFVSKPSPFAELEPSLNQGSNASWADACDENALQESYPKWIQVESFSVLVLLVFRYLKLFTKGEVIIVK